MRSSRVILALIAAAGAAGVVCWYAVRRPARDVVVPTAPDTAMRPDDSAQPVTGAYPMAAVPIEPGDLCAQVIGRKGGDFDTRANSVRGLASSLAANDLPALYEWLRSNDDPGGLPSGTLNALKNEVADALVAMDPPPPGLADELIAGYRNPSVDPVWRDYCIQFLGSLIPKTEDEAVRARIVGVLWDATRDTAEATAGTALIALHRNLDVEGVGSESLARRALEICGSSAKPPVKATALQTAALLRSPDALPVAREWALSGPATLRMAAIAAIGQLGDESDRSLLDRCSAEKDSRVKTAARAALKRLERNRG